MTNTRNTMPTNTSTTALLGERNKGNKEAEAQLIERMYKELHRLAHHYMRKERPGHLLQTTALVHEAYIRLANDKKTVFQNRTHFLAVAANTMRHVLVDFARKRNCIKRDGGIQISLEDAFAFSDEQSWQVVAIDEALTRLEQWDPRQAQIVELRLFAGLTIEETSKVLDVSTTTVKDEYQHAKAWLYCELSKGFETAGGQ